MRPTRLSSDSLEQQFGPTIIEVLSQHGERRITCTRAAESRQVLELSLVDFLEPGVAAFPAVHQAVLAGQSMGKAFREHQVRFERVTHTAQRYPVSVSFQQRFGNQQAATVVAASIVVGPQRTAYADILEIYNPEVDWPTTGGKLTTEQLMSLQVLEQFLADAT